MCFVNPLIHKNKIDIINFQINDSLKILIPLIIVIKT
jgi:hypothetical protein